MDIDKNGYPRKKIEHSDLIHRQIAYSEIYLKNRDKYPLPFSKYVVHHKDGNKKNFNSDNLTIVTKEEHRKIHGLPSKQLEIFKLPPRIKWWKVILFIIIFLSILVWLILSYVRVFTG